MAFTFVCKPVSEMLLVLLVVTTLCGHSGAEQTPGKLEGAGKQGWVDSALSCDGKKLLVAEVGERRMELIQASYSELSTLRARFQQESYLAALDVAEASSGEVWFEHPGKMRWHYTSPEEQDFVVVDDTFWFYQLEDRQVTIDTFKSVALSDLPIAFLMGLGDLRRDFQLVKACMGATPAGDELVILHLRDKGSKETTGEGAGSDGIQGLVLAVGAQSSLPIGAQVQHLGGNSTSVLFEESKVKGSFSPETFKLSWPKSVDVIDRR